jgi:SNF2-related domain
MLTISGFLFAEDKAQSTVMLDPERVMNLAVKYNSISGKKIRIYKSFQEVTYEVEVKDNILKRHAFIKGELIPYDVMVVIEKYGYCCYKDAVYFFNQNTLNDIYKFYLSNDLQLVIQTARTMVPTSLSLDGIRALSLYISQNNREHSIVEFKGSLYPYQKSGLTWLLERYKDFSGAMLADDMGLGKTAQVIAFIAESIRHSTLNKVIILVPNSLIANWVNEFKKWVLPS